MIIAGGWYQFCARGIEGRAIFRDDRDRLHFPQFAGELVERFRLRAHAYVLMENHYHLLTESGEANFAAGDSLAERFRGPFLYRLRSNHDA